MGGGPGGWSNPWWYLVLAGYQNVLVGIPSLILEEGKLGPGPVQDDEATAVLVKCPRVIPHTGYDLQRFCVARTRGAIAAQPVWSGSPASPTRCHRLAYRPSVGIQAVGDPQCFTSGHLQGFTCREVTGKRLSTLGAQARTTTPQDVGAWWPGW